MLKDLSSFIKEFKERQSSILDLTFNLVFDQKELVSVKVTKNLYIFN